jgi:hypothetical protein
MKNAYETQLVQLEELIVQQRKQVQTLKIALDDTEQRFTLVKVEEIHISKSIKNFCFSCLKNSKNKKIRLQAFQNQLLIAQEEKFQLRNEVIDSIISLIEIICFLFF